MRQLRLPQSRWKAVIQDLLLQRVQVASVWRDYTFGDCGTVVCHIDSGMPWTSNSWYNPGEYAGITGVDDDGNGEGILPKTPALMILAWHRQHADSAVPMSCMCRGGG